MSARVWGILVLVTVAGLGVVAKGRVPLAVGLTGIGAAAYGLLPPRSRHYLSRRLIRAVASIGVAMGIVWILVYHLPAMPPIHFAGETGFPGPGGPPARQPPEGFAPIDALGAYVDWLAGLPTGDLGDTQYSETVTEGIGRTIPISMQLLAYSQVIAAAIAVPGALVGARLRGRTADVGFRALSLLGLSVPVYVTGVLLVFLLSVGDLSVFGLDFGFRVLPSGRYTAPGESWFGHARSMALPSLSLGVSTAAIYLVLLRSELIQQLSQDHIDLARSKGVPNRRIVRVHALRPAAPSVVAAVAANAAAVFGHLILIERIFLLPGFGDYVIIAIIRNDLPAIIGALFVAACVLAAVNLFADALLVTIDPRIGSGSARQPAARL